ncbi:hypothetical protein GUJ93_ZPchr0011g28200 [Zizania palustris]|uniref:Fe2OG dioxygenase domain-containing protein n=1 Tax=Zizania palustris TaxID=103762 RepID=A0A8J5WLR6_ZIZPA|nr:hypothetical protein GUJ93_ZPchr0011g28200 [Zizania palustris]
MSAAVAAAASGAGDADPMALVKGYTADEIAIAGEFLTSWLPFLSAGLCPSCVDSIRNRVSSLMASAKEFPLRSLRIDQIEPSGWDSDPPPPPPPPQQQPHPAEKPRMSWADMAQEDELATGADEGTTTVAADDGEEGSEAGRPGVQLTREQRELMRFRNVVRKKDFVCFERVNGRLVNILAGLELHTGVFSAAEQRRIVEYVYTLQEKGKLGELGDRTYTEPQKWMRGKGRVTIQFGCCYNYATDKKGNPPGIIRTITSDPMPGLFKIVMNSMSVLILNGNGADVAKHCVPAVPSKRISITFRKMDPGKHPFSFIDDPELLDITPLETAIQETSRSSDEGKGKRPDIQIRNLSKSLSKKSKGRTYAQTLVPDILSQQTLHGQPTMSSTGAERERYSVGQSRESRYSVGPSRESRSQRGYRRDAISDGCYQRSSWLGSSREEAW